MVKIGSKVVFDVSYTNHSDQACAFKINSADYHLVIYSGTDRIWSSADCAKLVRTTATTLKPGETAGWSMTWNGKRSTQGKDCASRPEAPGAGYYHATSELKGAKAAEYLVILK